MKIQENKKNIKSIGKYAISYKKRVDITSERPGNYPKCMLWLRYQFGLDFCI